MRKMNSYTIWHGKEKPMRAIGCNQAQLLHFAEMYKGWHTFANDRATKNAVAGLLKKGYLEVAGDQFRFTYPGA